MSNLNVCVVCGTSENLNTSLDLNIDGGRVCVKLCDEHAEDTTPKMAKECYRDKKSEIDDIIAKARALGLDVSMPGDTSKLVIVESNQPQPQELASPIVPAPLKRKSIDTILQGGVDEGVLSTARVDAVSRSVRGVSGESAVPFSPYVPSGADKLDPALLEGKAKMGVGEGRNGQSIAIPQIRVDGLGTTVVTVRQGVNDAKLQDQFKRFAERSMSEIPSSKYTMGDCTFCHGNGSIDTGREIQTCPKCGGSGIRQV